MSSKRRYRDPRPGEVLMWLSSHAKKVVSMGNLTGKGLELRIVPAPCCGRSKEDNPSLQVNDQTGMWRCFSCSKVGNWFTLTRAFGDPLEIGDRYIDPVDSKLDFDQIAKLAKTAKRLVTGNHYPDLIEVAKQRGIEPETLKAFHVSSMGPKCLRWPIYAVHQYIDKDGQPKAKWEHVNSRLRVVVDRDTAKVGDWFELKGGPTNLLIGNHLLNLQSPKKRCYIFEGQWDAMIGHQIGLQNSFSIPSGTNNVDCQSLLRYIPEDWEVWLGMDMDGPGQKATEQFFAQLGSDRVARLKLPFKDLNDWYKENPFITAEDVEKTGVGLTSSMNLSSTKTGTGYVDFDMDEDASIHQPKVITDFPWSRLTTMLAGGLYEGQTTGLLAPSGVGKTTWCNQLATYAAGKGVKVGIISLEGTRDAFTTKLKYPIKGQWKPNHWPSVKQNLMISELQGPMVTPPQCLQEFERMIVEGAKLLILDNLDFICRDNGNAKMEAYAGLIEMASRTATHIIPVWQPNKIDRTTIVNSGNQKGYSQLLQDADNYINMNVIEDFVQLEVEKTREDGIDRMKNKVWMIYNRDIRCFSELEDMPAKASSSGSLISLDSEADPW